MEKFYYKKKKAFIRDVIFKSTIALLAAVYCFFVWYAWDNVDYFEKVFVFLIAPIGIGLIMMIVLDIINAKKPDVTIDYTNKIVKIGKYMSRNIYKVDISDVYIKAVRTKLVLYIEFLVAGSTRKIMLLNDKEIDGDLENLKKELLKFKNSK